MDCKKRQYPDEIAAKLVLASIARRDSGDRPKMECRTYECPSCKCWHLTSKKQVR